MIQMGKSVIFQSNFPNGQGGKASSVYYTVYNENGSEYIARTNSNVIEYGSGKYGVLLTFTTENNYSIYWDIDGTTYNAGEEIRIFDFTRQNVYFGYGV